MYREILIQCMRKISFNYKRKPYGKFAAMLRLFVQPNRKGGYKRGELFELLFAKNYAEYSEELGDIGYYLANSYDILWDIYRKNVSDRILEKAVRKFAKRAY